MENEAYCVFKTQVQGLKTGKALAEKEIFRSEDLLAEAAGNDAQGKVQTVAAEGVGSSEMVEGFEGLECQGGQVMGPSVMADLKRASTELESYILQRGCFQGRLQELHCQTESGHRSADSFLKSPQGLFWF